MPGLKTLAYCKNMNQLCDDQSNELTIHQIAIPIPTATIKGVSITAVNNAAEPAPTPTAKTSFNNGGGGEGIIETQSLLNKQTLIVLPLVTRKNKAAVTITTSPTIIDFPSGCLKKLVFVGSGGDCIRSTL